MPERLEVARELVEHRAAVGPPPERGRDVGRRLGREHVRDVRRAQRDAAQPPQVAPDLERARREALEQPVGVELAAAEEVAVEVLELAHGGVRREDDLEVDLPQPLEVLPVALEHVDEADRRRDGARLERLHRAEALEDLGQPLLLPGVLEPGDRRLEGRLGLPRALGDRVGWGVERHERGIDVAVQRPRLDAPERHGEPLERVRHAAREKRADELGLERRDLVGEVRPVALPQQPVLAGLEVHAEVGRLRNRLRPGEGGNGGHGWLLWGSRVVIGRHWRRKTSGPDQATSRSTGRPVSRSSATASAAAARACAMSIAGMRASRPGTGNSRTPPGAATVMRRLSAIVCARIARSSRPRTIASGVTVPATTLSPRPHAALTRTSSRAPVTGFALKTTPAASAGMSCWTRTAARSGVAGRPAWRR